MIHPVSEEAVQRPQRIPLVSPGQIDCHVRDMTVTGSADVTFAQLQNELSRHGQWLPMDGDANQSVGTLIACDSTGPLRLGYGAWRDLLLGVQFHNGKGDLITAGARTVKNVAGYDLTKFLVGQRGIFGNLLTITARTYRRPAGGILVRHPPDARRINQLIATSLKPQWALLTREALLCGYIGDEASLTFWETSIKESKQRYTLEDDIAHRARLWNIDGFIVFRASVPPANLNELSKKMPDVPWSADAAFGIVTGTVSHPDALADIRKVIEDVAGTLKVFEGATGPFRELSLQPLERQLIERLKRAFDSDHQLNPLPWSTA